MIHNARAWTGDFRVGGSGLVTDSKNVVLANGFPRDADNLKAVASNALLVIPAIISLEAGHALPRILFAEGLRCRANGAAGTFRWCLDILAVSCGR